MEKLSGSQIVVDVMNKEGVKKAFCVPGESYLGVIDALFEHPDIELMSTRHEGGASFMAEAYAKASGEVGVCMATRGPGAANLSIGLHTAMQDSTPLVALLGQVERPFKGKEAFQEVEFASYFSHLCKDAIEIDSAERIPELLHRAFHTARSGRPGPVVVSLPHDMLEDVVAYKEGIVSENYVPEAGEVVVDKVLRKLYDAKRPVIIAGGGVTATKSAKQLVQLSEAMKIPVVTAFRRFDAFPNDHAHYAGWLGFGADPSLLTHIKEADVILSIGNKFSQVTTQDYTLIGENTEIIQVDIDENMIGKAYAASIGIVSDAKLFLEKCLEQVQVVEDESREQVLKERRTAYLAFSTIPERIDEPGFTDMNAVIEDLLSAVPKDAIITSDAGNFFGWLSKYYRFTQEGTYIGPTSGAMGYGLPSAIGAKVAHPDKKVISFSGDGGFMMTMQELETAVRYDIPVVAVVVNNNMYGTIRMHQEIHFPTRVMGTDLSNPNFADLAKVFGCHGVQVTRNDQFLPALKKALQCGKPAVIEVVTNPDIISAAQCAKLALMTN